MSMVTKLETGASFREEALPAAPSATSHSIEVFERFADARADWLELFALAPASGYQSYDYVSAWFETIGRAKKLAAFIVVARGADGRPLALLPLARAVVGPLRLGLFMCGRESNFNLGLVRPGAGFDETAARRLLLEAARQAERPIDLYYLRNLPRRFDGALNPLASDGAPPSASFAYGTTLPGDEAALESRVSKDRRKKLRKKEAWLAELGEVRYEHRASGARVLDAVDALLAQKSARLAAMGVGASFDNSAMRAFLVRLGAAAGGGALELHALSVSGRIVATYAGLVHSGRFSALLNSFDADEKVARSSPGDLLLHALLADLVARGIAKFDLGAGEARYKNAVCDETIELCDLIAPATWKGALAAPLFTALLHAKRRIKQTPWMAKALARARRMLGKGAG